MVYVYVCRNCLSSTVVLAASHLWTVWPELAVVHIKHGSSSLIDNNRVTAAKTTMDDEIVMRARWDMCVMCVGSSNIQALH